MRYIRKGEVKMKKIGSLLLSLMLAFSMFLPNVLSPNMVYAEEDVVAMYRLYNPNSGEHFYTNDPAEKDRNVKAGWRDEGIGWYAPSKSNKPVYRLYNANAGDHHYTMDIEEKDNLVKLGWEDEGVGWYSDEQERVALYRQYNPNAKSGAHNYTTSKSENDYLVSIGWHAENIGWYGVKAGTSTGSKEQQPTATATPAASGSYIININSGIFHKPTCTSVEKMSEKNKQAYTGNRQELINQGYKPCHICNP